MSYRKAVIFILLMPFFALCIIAWCAINLTAKLFGKEAI